MDAPLKRILLAAILVAGLVPAALAQVTYRWVDAEGESFYSPVPPKDPDQPYVQLRDGVVEKSFAGLDRPQIPESEFAAERAAEEAQRKADALLLVQFKSIGDIDAAMETELDNLRYDFNLLDGTYRSLRQSLFEQIGLAADRQRAGLAVPDHELEKIEALRARIAGNRNSRVALGEREQSIRSEYDAKKQRFRVLMEQNAS